MLEPEASVFRKVIAHESLARAAKAAHQPGMAAQEYAEAARLFALTPHNEAEVNYAIELQIRNAHVDLINGQPESSLTRLLSAEDRIRSLTNDYLVQMFYETMGEVQLGRHRYAEAEQALLSALALAEKSRSSVKSESELIAWKNDSAPVYLALTEAKLLQGNSQEALDTYESYLGASRRGAVTEFSSRSSASLLSRETKIVYAALPDGLAIWVCNDHGEHSDWFAGSTTGLPELAARFLDLTSDPKSDIYSLRRDGRSLYSTLISPVEKRLTSGQPITIEADGWLASVPFEALVDSSNHYLIERWPVVHSISQNFEARDQKGGDAYPLVSGMPLLAVASAASSKTEDLIPLTGIDEEADAVATGFQSPRVLKNIDATLSAVKQDLPSAAVFHFAGHSLSTPDRSGLLLQSTSRRNQTPSLLDAASVRKLDLRNLRLAVLSACDTESGAGTSDGFNSITEAFLRAGVPHVVASRWAVVDTKAFITDFYRNTLAGEPVSESTRRASLNMLKNPTTAHPYYWSAFAAYGQP
jgi:CHAT domain-containing protein